jgi:hypothetical protein
MNGSPDDFADMARAIQLALAPVFLLTGIAGLLGVMTGRLARIIDRSRALEEGGSRIVNDQATESERETLEMRQHLTSMAITASTIAALLVCVVIAMLFLEVMLRAPLKWVIGGLFTGAMFALVFGLTFFLREVHCAMRHGASGARAPR